MIREAEKGRRGSHSIEAPDCFCVAKAWRPLLCHCGLKVSAASCTVLAPSQTLRDRKQTE